MQSTWTEKELMARNSRYHWAFIMLFAMNVPAALAHDGPTSSFDVTFEVLGPLGRGTLRQASDGKGHFLQESTAFNGNKDVVLVDFEARSKILVIPREKTAIRLELTPADKSLIYDEQSVKTKNAKSLGTKNILGHACHGWEINTPASREQCWLGDDTKYLVQSEVASGKQKITLSLKQWSSKPPGPSTFQVPAEYKLTSLPASGTASPGLVTPGMDVVQRYLQENKPAEAVDQLSEMLQKNPRDKMLLVIRAGILFRSLNRPEEALKDFNQAVEIDPNSFQTYKRRGEYYAHVKRKDDALSDYNKCLQLAPEYGECYLSRAILYAKDGQYKQAVEDLDKAEKYRVQDMAKLAQLKSACVSLLKK